MSHYLEYIPDKNYPDAPEDHEWNGAFVFTCDSDTTQPCRWTADCDCEEWVGMEIAEDGSSATHTHYQDIDDLPEDAEEEVDYPMVVAPCQLIWWFDESDYRDWAVPPREGRQLLTVTWEYDYYEFGYAEKIDGGNDE